MLAIAPTPADMMLVGIRTCRSCGSVEHSAWMIDSPDFIECFVCGEMAQEWANGTAAAAIPIDACDSFARCATYDAIAFAQRQMATLRRES